MRWVQRASRRTEDVCIYEVVGEDDDVVKRLIRYAHGLPSNRRFGVVLVPLANPVCAVLRWMGFVEGESMPHVMARILRLDRIFQRLAAGSDLLHSLSLTVATPHRTLVVNEPPQPRCTVQFETGEVCFRACAVVAWTRERRLIWSWSGGTGPMRA